VCLPIRLFEQALSCVDRERDIRAAYLFGGDDDAGYSVRRCDPLLDAGEIFNEPPAK
jgi:hypothetical protein